MRGNGQGPWGWMPIVCDHCGSRTYFERGFGWALAIKHGNMLEYWMIDEQPVRSSLFARGYSQTSSRKEYISTMTVRRELQTVGYFPTGSNRPGGDREIFQFIQQKNLFNGTIGLERNGESTYCRWYYFYQSKRRPYIFGFRHTPHVFDLPLTSSKLLLIE